MEKFWRQWWKDVAHIWIFVLFTCLGSGLVSMGIVYLYQHIDFQWVP